MLGCWCLLGCGRVVVMHGIVGGWGARARFGRPVSGLAADFRGCGGVGPWAGVELRWGLGGCIVF